MSQLCRMLHRVRLLPPKGRSPLVHFLSTAPLSSPLGRPECSGTATARATARSCLPRQLLQRQFALGKLSRMTCLDMRSLSFQVMKNQNCLDTKNQCMTNMKSMRSLFMRSMKSMRNQCTKNMKKPSLVMRSPWKPMSRLPRQLPPLHRPLHWTLATSPLLALADEVRLRHPEGQLQVASGGPSCWWRFNHHRLHLLLSNLVL